MLLWSKRYVYAWVKIARVTGKVGKCNKDTFACLDCDAYASGLYGDYVEQAVQIEVGYGRTDEQAFKQFKMQVLGFAEASGYTNNCVLCIDRKQFNAFQIKFRDQIDELDDQYYGPAYTGERTIRK